MKLKNLKKNYNMKKILKESGLRNIKALAERYPKAKIYFHQDLDGVTTALAMKNYLEDNGIKVVDSEIIQYGDKEFAVKKQDAEGDTMPVLVDFAHGKPMFVVHTDHHDSQTGVEGDTATSFRPSRSNVATLSQIMSPKEIFPSDDITLISTVDSADFARFGLTPDDIMNFVFKLQKDKSLQKNKMALGLATNKLMLAYKNKPGFMEELVMTSRPSLLNIFQNINRIAAKNGYALPEEMALNQKDYVAKQKESEKVRVEDGIIVQYGGGSMFKPGSYDRYTPFKNNPDADFLVIAWPMGLVQASCNPFNEERQLRGVNLGEIAQEVLGRWEDKLREKIIPLSTIKWVSETSIKEGSVGFTNADLEAFYGDKIRSIEGGEQKMERLKEIMDTPSTELTDNEWAVLDRLGVPAWEMIQANSGGHKCITNISALNYFGRSKRPPQGKYKYNKDSGDAPYVKFAKMIQAEFVNKLKEKIAESKSLNESVINESVSFLFPIGSDKFNVGYDSSGLGRGKEKVLDKDKAIHNSDYGPGDAKHQERGGHNGIDIFAPKGTPLVACVSGKIYKVGHHNGSGGNTVSILNNGVVYYYAHLDQIANNIERGMEISKGDFIGTVGDSGNAKGTHPHLHFSMYDAERGYKPGNIDPWPFLEQTLEEGGLTIIDPDSIVEKVKGKVVSYNLTIDDIINNGDNSELFSRGSRGKGVEEIQQILMSKGYDIGEQGVNGIYGPLTVKAVKQFQKDEGLNLVDGIVGIETSTALKGGRLFEQEAEKADLVDADSNQLLDNIKNIQGDIERSDSKNMRFKQDVESFQIGLSLLGYELPKHGVDGLFGPETEGALNEFKKDNELEENGIFDTDTRDIMHDKLKSADIKDEDIEKYTYASKEFSSLDGKITHRYSGMAARGIQRLIDTMVENGVTDPVAQVGMLAVIGKETHFINKREKGYHNTSNERIRKIFSRTRSMSDSELNNLKKDYDKFFNFVYNGRIGNNNENDGSKYVGRGYNQLTGKDNYEKYGNKVGIDIVNNPDKMLDDKIAAEVAVKFLTSKFLTSKDVPEFRSPKEATLYFADVNSGSPKRRARENSIEELQKFDIVQNA